MSAVKHSDKAAVADPAAKPKGRGKLAKALLTLLAIGALVVAGLAAVIAMQPDTFHVERSATMAAAPEAVFTQVNDFHNWDKWSPWLDLDPDSKVTFEGPEAGEDAIFRWAGNDQVGEGSMTILESRPHEYVKIELHFIKPFEDTAITEFKLAPEGDATNVTWTMDGQHNFISKAMCLLVMDMDKMIGDKYDEGLANMKAIVEGPPETQAESTPPAEEATQSSSEDQP